MKIKKILVVSLILLTMITIGAVSAHEDATALGIDGGEPSSSDEISLQSADDAVLGEDAKEDLNFTVTNDKEMVNYKEGVIYHSSEIYFEVEEGGNSLPVKLYVDDEECEITNFDMDSLFFNTSKLSLGEHKYVVNFLGNKFYNPASAGGAFNITEIAVNADEKYTINSMEQPLVTIIVPTTVTGEITVMVDEQAQSKDIEFDEYDLEAGYQYLFFNIARYNVACGENNITVLLNGETIRTYKLKTDYIIYLDDEKVRYGNGTYGVELPIGMDPDLAEISIDGKKYETEYVIKGDGMYNGARILSVNTTKDLSLGNHSVVFSYAGDEMFTKESFNGTITVVPIIQVPYNAMREDSFTLTMPDDCNETLELYVQYTGDDSKPYLYTTVKAKGEIAIPLENLTKYGSYFFDTKPIKGYTIYNDMYFTLNPDLTYPKTFTIGSDESVSIELANHTGILTVYDDNGDIYGQTNLTDGKASISLKTLILPEGKQVLSVNFDDRTGIENELEMGDWYQYSLDIDVKKPEITLPSEKVLLGDQPVVSVDLPGMNGTLIVRVNVKEGDGCATDFVNGKATVNVAKLKEGNNSHYAHLLLGNFNENGTFTPLGEYSYFFDTLVINPISAKDATATYSSTLKYKANIKDIDGNPVQSGKVTFYILDGTKQLVKKTVDIKNGVATLTYKVTQPPKTYKIKTEFNKATLTKKLTVKHAVTLKTATVKKSSKKLTLQATLAKVDGKFLKGKWVTFKFNGKTYKAKTNSKGIAKVTIPKSVLSKLKVGKSITYQATYLKDTVKKTAKVQK